MDRSTNLSDGRRQLLETLAGHFQLLKESHPRKAASATAKRAQRYITQSLRQPHQRKRAA